MRETPLLQSTIYGHAGQALGREGFDQPPPDHITQFQYYYVQWLLDFTYTGHTAHLIPRDVFCCKQNIEMYYIAAFALPCSEPALVYTTCDAVGGAQKPAEGSNAGIGLISAKRRSRNKGRAVSLEETSEKQAMEPWTTGKHTSMDACATSASHRRCHFHVLRMDTNG